MKKMAFADSLVLHDEGNPTLIGLFKKRRYYGAGYARFVKKHGWSGARRMTPARGSLMKNLPALFRDPAVGVGIFVLKATELAGVLSGAFFGSSGGSARSIALRSAASKKSLDGAHRPGGYRVLPERRFCRSDAELHPRLGVVALKAQFVVNSAMACALQPL